jgi:hypothetical protein
MQESAVKIPPEAIVGESEKQCYLALEPCDSRLLKIISNPTGRTRRSSPRKKW